MHSEHSQDKEQCFGCDLLLLLKRSFSKIGCRKMIKLEVCTGGVGSPIEQPLRRGEAVRTEYLFLECPSLTLSTVGLTKVALVS